MRDLNLQEKLSLVVRVVAGTRFLRRSPLLDPASMRDWQLRRIRDLVRHAYEATAFYRRLYDGVSFKPADLRTWDDFARLPVVTKDQVIAAFPQEILSRGVKLDDLIVSRSSGSSGKVLDVAYDGKATVTYILAGLRLYRMCFHYRPWHRQAYVYTSPYPISSLFGMYPTTFISTLAPVPEIVETLKRSRPDLLVCYPSHLRQVVAAMSEGDIASLGLKAVSTNSEMSTQAERDALAARLGCPVLDEYSSEELTRIAAQCRQKTYHVFEDINFIETLDAAGRPAPEGGVITGTNLHNFAMPLIRYQQNDLGRLEETTCPCGWRFRALTQLEGRRNDSFTMPSGKELTSGFLLDATYEFLLTHRTAVTDFCLVQETVSSVMLQVVPGPGWSDEISRQIARRFREFLEPGVSFRVDEVEVCLKTKTGKRNPIVSRVRSRT